jgi:hypothetical protein
MLLKTLVVSLFSMAALASIAKIERIKGKVFLNDKVAKIGARVVEGDILQAKGKKSLFIIRYDNGSKYMLRNGRLKVEKLEAKKSKLYLFSGKLVTSVKKNTYEKDGFEVKTKTAAMGVRGTKFWISETEEDSYLCVCEGIVSAKNQSSEILVKRNEDVHIKSSNKLAVQKANNQMMSMALDDFELMGEPVK